MREIKDTIYNEIITELWKIRHPHLSFNKELYALFKKKILKRIKKEKTLKNRYRIPTLFKKAFFELTTARNRNLIDETEQNQLRKTVAAFFGLSVGSHAAITWIISSRADVVKIADPDTISASNLNRLRAGWEDIGRLKTKVVEEELYEINPFTRVDSFYRCTPGEIGKIFTDDPAINIVVEEADDFEAKIYIRRLAKERRVPLISAADVGDNVILDIERYDQFPQPDLFLGRVPVVGKINFSRLSDKDKKKLIINLVGFEKNSEKMLNSLFAIEGSVVSWPQLGSTATLAGAVIATTIKKIVLGEKIKNGRYFISLDDILVADFNERDRKQARDKKIKQLKSLLEK